MVFHNDTYHNENGDFSARKADLVDKHVGQKLRDKRRDMNMSQQDIAEILTISYQQLQKYECGANRISAGRLYMLATILGVNISYFFDGLPATETTNLNKTAESVLSDSLASLSNGTIRNAMEELVQAINESQQLQ